MVKKTLILNLKELTLKEFIVFLKNNKGYVKGKGNGYIEWEEQDE